MEGTTKVENGSKSESHCGGTSRPGEAVAVMPDEAQIDCSTTAAEESLFERSKSIVCWQRTLLSQQDQQLQWQAFKVSEWHTLCDGALQDIAQVGFHVETDKGFKYSELDESFICQKKNHFQITVTTTFCKTPKYLKIEDGSIEKIEKFVLTLEGVKFDDVKTKIALKQSKKIDRSKSDFQPIGIEISSRLKKPVKITICRLHFSETTANNTKKRGKPNPDQKYFSLVVSLKALTKERIVTVVSHASERIIVRTSTPGVYDVQDAYVDPTPETDIEHEDCKKEIDILKSAIKELQHIVSSHQMQISLVLEQSPHVHTLKGGGSSVEAAVSNSSQLCSSHCQS